MADEVLILRGVEGLAVYVNGYRVAGPKPWGGGTILKKWSVERASFDEALKTRAVLHDGDDGCRTTEKQFAADTAHRTTEGE